jgi:hypothetical protein
MVAAPYRESIRFHEYRHAARNDIAQGKLREPDPATATTISPEHVVDGIQNLNQPCSWR